VATDAATGKVTWQQTQPQSKAASTGQVPAGAAAAAPINPQSRQGPVTATGVPDIFDLQYFKALQMCGGLRHYRRHNEALKWFRCWGERIHTGAVIMPNTRPAQVAMCVHDHGTGFAFDENAQKNDWVWQEFVAQMNDESMQLVVEGPDGRSRGIVQCRIQETERYDHQREASRRKRGIPLGEDMLKQWDIFLVRDDGSSSGLHPNYSHPKIECCDGPAVAVGNVWIGEGCGCKGLTMARGPPIQTVPQELPATGLGGTSGPGTFKHFKEKHVRRFLRFNTSLDIDAAGVTLRCDIDPTGV